MMNKEYILKRFGRLYSHTEREIIETAMVIQEMFLGLKDLSKIYCFFSLKRKSFLIINPKEGNVLFKIIGMNYTDGIKEVTKFLKVGGYLSRRDKDAKKSKR